MRERERESNLIARQPRSKIIWLKREATNRYESNHIQSLSGCMCRMDHRFGRHWFMLDVFKCSHMHTGTVLNCYLKSIRFPLFFVSVVVFISFDRRLNLFRCEAITKPIEDTTLTRIKVRKLNGKEGIDDSIRISFFYFSNYIFKPPY